MQQSTFWKLSLGLHAPLHACLVVAHIADPYRNEPNRRAIAKGWPPRLVGLMQFYCHLTTCSHALTVAYLSLSLHGGYPAARHVVRALNWTVSTVVGIFWQVLSRTRLTKSGPHPPWTMFPREEFPADDAKAEWIVRRLLSPSWSGMLPIYCVLQVQHVLMPLAPWVEQALWPEMPALSLSTEVALLLAFAAWWLAWSIGLAWRARGTPPYPVLGAAYDEGVRCWLPIYVGIIGSGLMFVVVTHNF